MFLNPADCHGDCQINGSPDVTKWILIINLIPNRKQQSCRKDSIPETRGAKINRPYPDFDIHIHIHIHTHGFQSVDTCILALHKGMFFSD